MNSKPTMTDCITDEDAPHSFQVFLNEDVDPPVFEGYCSVCGYVVDMPVQKIEDAFKHE